MHTYIPTVMPTHLHADLHACLHTHPHIAFTWFCIGRAIEKSSENEKTCVFQNHSTGPSKAQNEWSNTRSMDLDGDMASSINLICVCLCFAGSFFCKIVVPQDWQNLQVFLEKELCARNLMLGGQNFVARELFSRKKYPPAERPPKYGDEGVFSGKSQISMFFLCLGISYAIPCLAWLGWACWCRDFSASAVCVQACLVGLLLACLGPTSMAGLPGLAVCLLSGALTIVLIGVHTYLHTHPHTYTHTYTMAYIPTCIHIYILPYLHTHAVP